MKIPGLPSTAVIYTVLALSAIILILSIALKVQYSLHRATKAEFAAFVTATEVVGKAAEAEAKRRIADDKKRKKEADDENAKSIAALRARIAGLQRDNPGRGTVPSAPAGSSRPDLAAFDRAEYIRAYRELVEEIRGLGVEGSEAVVNLNTAKEWVQK